MPDQSHAVKRKQERIFVNTFWNNHEVRAKIMTIAEREGIIPSQADVEMNMRAKMIGHSAHDDYMC